MATDPFAVFGRFDTTGPGGGVDPGFGAVNPLLFPHDYAYPSPADGDDTYDSPQEQADRLGAVLSSRYAPLDSPEFVGEISIENDVPGAGYPFTVKVDTGHADGLLDRFTVENNASQPRVDINMRGANLNIGMSTSTDGNSQGGSIYLVRGTGDSSTPFACYKQGSDSVVGLRITPACGLDMRNTDLTSTAITIQNSTATTKVLQVTNTGALWWGNTGDTVLERKAASVLGVGADDYLRLGSTTTAGRMSASTAGAGAVMWDTDLGQLIVSNGTTWEAVTSA